MDQVRTASQLVEPLAVALTATHTHTLTHLITSLVTTLAHAHALFTSMPVNHHRPMPRAHHPSST
jgi:hypothetical protein